MSQSTNSLLSEIASPPSSPRDPPRRQYPLNAITTREHKEHYKFIIKDSSPINLYVQFEYMDNDKFFDWESNGNHVWLTFDWMVLDWFTNYNRRMGIQVDELDVVKNIALTFWEDL